MKRIHLSLLSVLTAASLLLPGLTARAYVDVYPPTVDVVRPTTGVAGTAVSYYAAYNDDTGVTICMLLEGGVSLGNMALGGGTATLSLSLTAGIHNLQVKCNDAAGNWGSGEITPVTISTAGTVGSVTPTSAFSGIATTMSATYGGFNAPYTAHGCWLVVDGSTVYPEMTLSSGPDSVSGTASKSYTFASNGTYTVRVSCLENGGSYKVGADTTITVSTAADITGPTVGTVSPTSAVAGVSVAYSATYNDAVGVTQCQLMDGVTVFSPMTLSAGTASYSVMLSVGTHNLQVKCSDAAGNTGNGTPTTVLVSAAGGDVTAPSVGSVLPTTAVLGVAGNMYANYSDAVGVTSCTVYIDGAGTSGYLSGTALGGQGYISWLPTTLGAHTLHIDCRDAAGNTGIGPSTTVTVSAAATTDLTVPNVGNVFMNYDSPVAGSLVYFYVNATDNVGVSSCRLVLDGSDAGIMSLGASGSYQLAYTFSSSGSDTSHSAVARCYDAAGNSGASVGTRYFTVTRSPATGTISTGALIKLACPTGAAADHPCKAVYYVGSDAKRHAFSNSKVYFTWYANFSSVQDVSASAMSSYALGRNVTYRPGIRMVKFTTVNTVYAVTRGGLLRPIASEAIARVLYGTNWNQQIDDIGDAFYTNYTFGASINNASDYSPAGESAAITTVDANF